MRRATAIESYCEDAIETLTLAYDERLRRRGVLVCDGGLEVLLDLDEARELSPGLALLLEGGGRIALRAAAEPLASVRAADGASLARLAWHVGNRHTPCMIRGDRLFIRRDPVLEAMLAGLGAAIEAVTAAFLPEGGAYGHGRTHAHAHADAPTDDPDAALRAALGGRTR